MEWYEILSRIRCRKIEGFVQIFEEKINNSHSINVSILG